MTEPTPAGEASVVVEVPAAEPAPSVRSSKDKLAGGTPQERHIPIVLSGDLLAEHAALEARLAEAITRRTLDPRLNNAEDRQLAAEIEALEQRMRDDAIVVKMRPMPRRAWDDLMDLHPARESEDEDQAIGYNADSFFPAAIRACACEPDDLDDEGWRVLLDEKATTWQYRQLCDAVLALNVRRVDIPNSRAASRILRGSDSG